MSFCLGVASVSHGQEKEQNLAYADLLYSQKEYAKAARQYQIFIREDAASPNAQSGWFRLGECYLQVGQITDAKTTFDHIIKTFKTGAFVGSSAYRLAVLSFNAKDYPAAEKQFAIAAKELTAADAKHQAKYYHARSLQLNKKLDPALALYDEVIRSNPNMQENPFLERSLLETARIFSDKGEKDKAGETFRKLASTAITTEVKEEAIVRGGMIAWELGKTEESEQLLDQAFRFPNTSPWKSLAQVGAIFNAFSRKDYRRVTAIYGSGALNTTIEEYRPKMLLIVGHSYRMTGEADAASRLYSLVESRYPDTEEGLEAGFRKLQILHETKNGALPSMANRFISKVSKTKPEHQFLDMAQLMKAEYHFAEAEKGAARKDKRYAQTNYRAAADAYGEVREQNVKEKFHSLRLYKRGWAYLEAGELQDGILSISRFIKRFPKDPMAPSALAKRGMTYQSVEDFEFALDDYDLIIKDYPDSSVLELAMQQKALIFAQKRDLPKMITAYEELLKRFPNTPGKAEATYWIGVGHYDLERFAKAIPALETARRLNPQAFTNRASIRIILAHYSLEQIPELTEAARAYILSGADAGALTAAQKEDKKIPVPKAVLEYLGKKLFTEKKYADSEFFLSHMSTPNSPQDTASDIWKLIADARIKTGKFEPAIQAYDFYLAAADKPAQRGYAYLERGKAQLAISKLANARESARECLKIVKQGRYNAEARILLGDVLMVEGALNDAAAEYLIVSEVFEDPEVTPLALTKAINVYQKLGDDAKAQELGAKLQARFPDYRPRAGVVATPQLDPTQ